MAAPLARSPRIRIHTPPVSGTIRKARAPQTFVLGVFVVGATCAWSVIAHAHGTHEELLEAATARIEEEEGEGPASAGAYLERANLYREAGRMAEAWADVARASDRNPALPEVGLLRAMILIDSGLGPAANLVLDSLLARHPRLAEARALRANALEAEGRNLEAADELDRALADLACPAPDHYLHLARMLVAAQPPQRARALQALERGIERLGPAPALVSHAVELELSRGDTEAALRCHDRLRRFMESDPAWLARRGELLEATGRRWDALATYTAALEAIEKLPTSRREVPATKGLQAELQSRLTQPTAGRGEAER